VEVVVEDGLDTRMVWLEVLVVVKVVAEEELPIPMVLEILQALLLHRVTTVDLVVTLSRVEGLVVEEQEQ
jgi:hypothetical protein